MMQQVGVCLCNQAVADNTDGFNLEQLQAANMDSCRVNILTRLDTNDFKAVVWLV